MTIVSAQFEQPWGYGSEACTTGNVFVPGPGGISEPNPVTDLSPTFVIPAAPKYNLVHAVTVTHDGEDVEFANFTISTDDGSICWTLNATGGRDLFERFATADQEIVIITIDGQEWQFVVEGVSRNRAFPSASVSITGRSLTILAGDPFSFVKNWVNNGPITAAQIVDQAQEFTTLDVTWGLEDWLVPDRVWYFTGTPLAVAQRVAESVSAIVISSRNEMAISLVPRYPTLPHEWSTTQPDVEIHADALMVDSYERADRPAYNAVMVSGQQQGATGRVFLAGTAADKLAPLVTDLLITDVEAIVQRGQAILGASGPQARVQATLPVIVEGEGPGVLNVNQLCHIVDDGADWWGMVRSVSVTCQLPSVLQSIGFERHTGTIAGTTVPEVPVDTPAAGAITKTLGDVTLVATGALSGAVGALAKTLANVTLVAAGEEDEEVDFSFLDTFTGTGALNAHTADSGGTWMDFVDIPWFPGDPSGTTALVLNGSGQLVVGTPGYRPVGVAEALALTGDHDIEIDFIYNAGAGPYMGFLSTPDGPAYIMSWFINSGGEAFQIDVYSTDAGGSQVGSTETITDDYEPSAMHTLKIAVRGTEKSFYIDTVLKLTIDNSVSTVGTFWMGLYDSWNFLVDRVQITPQ